jgi:hypothetical protein
LAPGASSRDPTRPSRTIGCRFAASASRLAAPRVFATILIDVRSSTTKTTPAFTSRSRSRAVASSIASIVATQPTVIGVRTGITTTW